MSAGYIERVSGERLSEAKVRVTETGENHLGLRGLS